MGGCPVSVYINKVLSCSTMINFRSREGYNHVCRWCHLGRIKPPKAARGHATSNSANIDSIVLNVTKNRGPCAACKTPHTVEVLISIYKYTLT